MDKNDDKVEDFTKNDLSTMEVQAKKGVATDMYRSTGELEAEWEGCEDGHEEPGDHEDGCSEDFEYLYEECIDDITILEHGGEECEGARPAREFYLDFNAHLKRDNAKGEVLFRGIGTYKGINFDGDVSWVKVGREPNELFFGGKVTTSTVNRGCFLFSVQDNGEGKNAEADRMQYRLYGSLNSPCHVPNHLPVGYPIAVSDGNLQVH
jgi:hypothetical protein